MPANSILKTITNVHESSFVDSIGLMRALLKRACILVREDGKLVRPTFGIGITRGKRAIRMADAGQMPTDRFRGRKKLQRLAINFKMGGSLR